MRVLFTATAEQDLIETLTFFRAPSAMGDDFNATVAFAVAHLRQWPYTGHRRRDLTRRDVCFWYEKPYLVAIQISGETLTIVAVLHGSRDMSRVLKKRFKKTR